MTVRFGILGPGNIANKFADGMKNVSVAEIVAVASRDRSRAEAFAQAHGAQRVYDDYAALAADRDVDIVYVATPHTFHKEQALLCIEAGKAVLCEKPITVNAGETETLIRAARAKNVFLMEGMWTRFFPVMVKVRELLAEKAIGEVRMVQADFGFRGGDNAEGRHLNPALAGGGLLDVGVYPLAFSSMVFGAPKEVKGVAEIGSTGVDEQCAWVLAYENGAVAMGAGAVRTNTPMEAYILGTDGRIHVHAPFWRPERLTLTRYGQESESFEYPHTDHGFSHEIAAVCDALEKGLTEHPVIPLEESLQLQQTMDELRRQWGLKYPFE